MGVAYVGVNVLRYLKEDLACQWATDKWLRIISNIMLFKTVILQIVSHNNIVCIAMRSLVTQLFCNILLTDATWFYH